MTFLFFGAKSLKTMLPTLPMLPPEKLTHENHAVILNAPRNIGGGCGNPFRKGDNTPQSLKAVFLCLSFLAWRVFALCNSIMTALFWRPLRSVVPFRGITTRFNAVTNTVVSISDGFNHSKRKGITA
jgi:hypothetical protein